MTLNKYCSNQQLTMSRYERERKIKTNQLMRRKLSSRMLKSKSEVEKAAAFRQKNFLEDPFKNTVRQSDYL